MLTKAICVMGEAAARMFYEPGRFTRKGAMPITALALLQDRGSVNVLDGEAHHRRKQMFMALMTPAHIERLVNVFTSSWYDAIGRWERRGEVLLHNEVHAVLCDAVCAWAGVPLPASQLPQRTREFAAMIDGAGAIGPRNWRGHLLRASTEGWVRDIIGQVRSGRLVVPEGSAAQVIAGHRELNGELLDLRVAAVELINVLRPVVAVARFITFAALALHQHPECRQQIQAGDDAYLERFVQEVRRFYPFFPFVGGRAQQAFDWQGYHFAEGTWVLLDLYGTNHDQRIWQEPERFQPERFRQWDGSPFNFIAQGGGDFIVDHRCAGEWITIALMKRAAQLLTTAMQYEVPKQDLEIDLSRMPAVPKSRFRIGNIQRTG